MSDTTKKKAYEKLNAIVNNIGYPDTWRDYSSVLIKSDDYAGNTVRAGAFEVQRQYKKIDRPTDRKDWGMTPADGECLLPASDERYQFPRRHFAASVLRQADG
jgi:putative endopeptidase